MVPGGGEHHFRRVDTVCDVVGVGSGVLVDQQVFSVEINPADGGTGHICFTGEGDGGTQKQTSTVGVDEAVVPPDHFRPVVFQKRGDVCMVKLPTPLEKQLISIREQLAGAVAVQIKNCRVTSINPGQ